MSLSALAQHRRVQDSQQGGEDKQQRCISLLQLPDECLLLILFRIPLHELVHVSYTCKRMRRLATDASIWNEQFVNILESIYPSKGSKRRKRSFITRQLKTQHRSMKYLYNLQSNLFKIESIPDTVLDTLRNSKQLFIQHALEEDIWLYHDPERAEVVPERDEIIWGERKPCCTKVVLAGSLNRLVEVLTCVEVLDLQFVKAFLMTFESFTCIELFFVKLMQRYHVMSPSSSSSSLSCSCNYSLSDPRMKSEILPIRFRVVNILKLLIEKHVERVYENQWLMERLVLLIGLTLPSHGLEKLALQLKELLRKKIKEYETQQEQVEQLACMLPVPATFSWTPFPDELIASQITLLDHLTYRSIKSSEMLDKGWNQTDKYIRSPNLMQMLNRFNCLSHWVSSEILRHNSSRLRVQTIERFLNIGDHLFKLNNFQSMAAVLAALNNYAVVRLKKTWSKITQTALDQFHKMEDIMSAQYSYKNYRKTIYTVEPPCVPFLNVIMMELDFLEGGREFASHLVAFGRRQRIYEVISFALLYQTPTFSILLHSDLYNYLYHLPRDVNEDNLVQRSLLVEP